jgi:hypothetical protein
MIAHKGEYVIMAIASLSIVLLGLIASAAAGII